MIQHILLLEFISIYSACALLISECCLFPDPIFQAVNISALLYLFDLILIIELFFSMYRNLSWLHPVRFLSQFYIARNNEPQEIKKTINLRNTHVHLIICSYISGNVYTHTVLYNKHTLNTEYVYTMCIYILWMYTCVYCMCITHTVLYNKRL